MTDDRTPEWNDWKCLNCDSVNGPRDGTLCDICAYDDEVGDLVELVVRQPGAGAAGLTPDTAAVAATLVDLMKRSLPPHITESQQAEAYVALSRIARGAQGVT